MDRTVVFLDIDGCVSPLPPEYPGTYKEVSNLRVKVSPHILDFLAELTPYNAVWHSSWHDLSTLFNDELGQDHFPTIFDPMGKKTKKESIEEFLDDHPEIETAVIVEDDPFTIRNRSCVLVHCDYRYGLTNNQTEIIRMALRGKIMGRMYSDSSIIGEVSGVRLFGDEPLWIGYIDGIPVYSLEEIKNNDRVSVVIEDDYITRSTSTMGHIDKVLID